MFHIIPFRYIVRGAGKLAWSLARLCMGTAVHPQLGKLLLILLAGYSKEHFQ